MNGTWTNERIATATERWLAGVSIGEIGGELGLTRGTVSGKLHRLGLLHKGQTSRSADYHVKMLAQRRQTVIAQPASPASGKQLQDLTAHDCRYPYGDPVQRGFFFCGALRRQDTVSHC